jgi:S1-C subfamily serine protease
MRAQAQAQKVTGDLSSTAPLSLPDLYIKIRGSVVQVSNVVSTIDGQGSRLGSGFVYDNLGHIVTNSHVVGTDSKAAQFDVTFSDGNSYMAHLVGSDPYSDLAVLELQGAPNNKLVPLSISNSSELRVGDSVIAIGNPFGLAGSMTTGIVSGLSRTLPSGDDTSAAKPLALSFSIPNIIQTDAAINPGNSGGPLLNSNGEVIGINTAIYSNTGVYSGVGFAVPSNNILKIVPSLIKTGTYQHPYLGIAGSIVTPSLSRQLGLSETGGFLITSVTPNGPADMSGLRPTQIGQSDLGTTVASRGDIILKIDDRPVKKFDDIVSYLESHSSVGDTVHLTVNRSGEVKDVSVVLEARPTLQKLQNVAAEQPSPEFGAPSDNGDDSLYEQCSNIAGDPLCGFLFGNR